MDLLKYVGMTESTALSEIEATNTQVRVKSRIVNGVAEPIRGDASLQMERLNLFVEDGIVVKVVRG